MKKIIKYVEEMKEGRAGNKQLMKQKKKIFLLILNIYISNIMMHYGDKLTACVWLFIAWLNNGCFSYGN